MGSTHSVFKHSNINVNNEVIKVFISNLLITFNINELNDFIKNEASSAFSKGDNYSSSSSS